ncbi:MAG: YsnF/AvaK domain-containing protein [Methyloceanibacter sp.]
MHQILVAVFDTVANADRAVQALENADVSSASIRRYHRDDPAMENLGTRTSTHVGPVSTAAVDADRVHQRSSGFWAWLTGEEGGTTDPAYESDHAYYGRHIDSGSTVLAVTVEQAESQRVMDLLADQMPLKLEDVGTEASATGTQDTSAMTAMREGTMREGTMDGVCEGTMREVGMMGTPHAMTEPNRISETNEREEVIPLAEEQVEIGKRRVDHATRIRRYVVETPVERQVTLRDETVEIERRRPVEGTSPGAGAFEERTVEVHTSSEQPEVTKTANIAEEVVVHKTVTDRPETIRETVRKEQVEVIKDDPVAARRG